MCNPAYLHLDCESFVVAETSALEEYESKLDQLEWADDEIAAIRVALQKLTSIRILNSNDAEDLVQDTLLTMIAKCPANELEKGLLVWSMGILRKKVGNYYRKAQRYASFNEHEAGVRRWIQKPMHTASPEVKVFNKELQTIIDEKLAEFPPSQRQVMELLVEGFDAREIVEQLHPERYQNVINRLYRGRKRLAKELAKCGYGPDARTGNGRVNLRKAMKIRSQ